MLIPLLARKSEKSGTTCMRRLTCANGTSRITASALLSGKDQHRRWQPLAPNGHAGSDSTGAHSQTYA